MKIVHSAVCMHISLRNVYVVIQSSHSFSFTPYLLNGSETTISKVTYLMEITLSYYDSITLSKTS